MLNVAIDCKLIVNLRYRKIEKPKGIWRNLSVFLFKLILFFNKYYYTNKLHIIRMSLYYNCLNMFRCPGTISRELIGCVS